MTSARGSEPADEIVRVFGPVRESAEFRRTHYRVYDEDGFASSFATQPPENATLESVSAHIVERFDGTCGMGYESKDLVVLLGSRIVAVVRGSSSGPPVVTTFHD
jgi:hypothetical protein